MITDNDVVQDLLPILEEAGDIGRLIGEEATITEVEEARPERGTILLTLSDGTRVEVRVRVLGG